VECPTRLFARTGYIWHEGLLDYYCDKKTGAVEISYRQFVYPNPSASRAEKIATSSLCAIAVSLL
jgi:hypothetical protein